MSDAAANAAPVEAEPVELGYAHARPNTAGAGLGLNGKDVIGPPGTVFLPPRCVITGDDADDAAAAGTDLVQVDKRLYGVATWVKVLAIVGLVLFRPLLLVAAICYFVVRKPVDVQYRIRRDLRTRRRWIVALALVSAAAALAIGIVGLAVQDNPLWFVVGVLGLIASLIVAVVAGRSVYVRRVTEDKSVLTGFGRGFLARAEFEYVRPRGTR